MVGTLLTAHPPDPEGLDIRTGKSFLFVPTAFASFDVLCFLPFCFFDGAFSCLVVFQLGEKQSGLFVFWFRRAVGILLSPAL